MLFKVLAVAGWAAVASVSSVSAQSLSGPAEMPPAGFKGSQYVDSRGCVFLRAGIGGRVNWVPRISRDRKALCGPSPAATARAVAKAEAAAPAPETRQAAAPRTPERVGRPMETIASVRHPKPAITPAPQPRVAAAPAPKAPAADSRLMRGCPSTSPYGARVTLSDGRRSLICSSDANFDVQAALASVQAKGRETAPRSVAAPAPRAAAPVAMADNDGYTPRRPAVTRSYGPQTAGMYTPRVAEPRVTAPRVMEPRVAPPVVAANDGYTPKPSRAAVGYRCPANAPVAKRFQVQGGGTTVMCTTAAGGLADATPALTVPKGYKKAWTDGRLNPNRGKGTARGQAQQDRVWSRDVPAQQVAAAPKAARQVYATSASNAPQRTAAATGRFFVQVGTFGDAANATRTAARLKGLGLPVAKSRITSKGRPLQIIMAGPFTDKGSAQAALSAARRSGFGDAFIR